jgi:hypothetical protein
MTKVLGVFVKKASRQSVLEGMRIIKSRYVSNQKLITNNNQLKNDAIKAIDKHHDISKNYQLKENDVSTYIASSSISHLLDGWGYLSQAVKALLSGNEGAAIHLAYYAELRAVMGLLASEGIGVFSTKHLVLESSNKFSLFVRRKKRNQSGSGNKLGTHVFAWEAFEKWCRSDVKPSYDLLRIFRVKGHNFSDLLSGFHPQATQIVSSSIAKSWLKEWAFDVRKFINDRELRNFVSYRPQSLTNFDEEVDIKSTIKSVYELFHVLSPTVGTPFDYLDKLLLKALYEELYQRPEIRSRGSFDTLVEDAFNHVGTNLDFTTKSILLSGTPNNQLHTIFSQAIDQSTTALSIISRAALLLRVSTGSTSLLLRDSGVGASELNFVWNNYGFNNGFWNGDKPVNEFYDLWSEIESEFIDISNSMEGLVNSPVSIKNGLDEDLDMLTQFNRAMLWGIAV